MKRGRSALGRTLRLATVCGAISISTLAHARCEDLIPDTRRGATPSVPRPVTATDLVRLRDIGFPDATNPDRPSPLAVSPDGKSAAFILMRADPVANDYCRALLVVPLQPNAAPRLVDRGGDYIMMDGPVRGLLATLGPPRTITPVWSPDGQWIAYLKREHGVTQIWRVRADGGGASQVTHSPVDIESLLWPADGKLLYTARPDRLARERAIDTEGRSGWLYDARITPNASARPRLRMTDIPIHLYSIDPVSGIVAEADAAQKISYAGAQQISEGSLAVSAAGARAWTEAISPSPLSDRVLRTAPASGRAVACTALACRGRLDGLWWQEDGRTLIISRREGWKNSVTAFYMWRPGHGQPRRVLATEDAVQGCVPAENGLVCTRESAALPRHVVLLDPANGTSVTIFDPNPEFHDIALGSVRRLKWRNDHGFEAWGDLVLPPGYRRGEKLPLVVVQYHSEGFLRGGTNDEYPVYLFAAAGIAVLSLERPTVVAGLDPKATTGDAMLAANYAHWAEHKSLLSSLLTGVDAAIATGAVDPARIGLTGLSDGATLTRFALINSHRFAAAAISTCCIEPHTAKTYGGIAMSDFFSRMGFPGVERPDPAFWAEMSLTQNAARIHTPLLMQLADDEYLLALEAFEALRENGQPTELYVYPDEHHGKWQPAHRLAVYSRDVDWFSFWLQGREDVSTAKRAQYARWRMMRDPTG
ncbi:Atxe2 family lasso peptide isopeptidase [Sphingomonas crusticola]|uniref:Atxe2 family lasso peptide isopeptidase n=1 Tax=Sphingomonas crusticola TaxID=1697973 RepID=UPI0013C2DCE8|nr:Atxe2 family lasso peptide isopeptidase [Sphingomonas crusticola]